MATKAGTDGRPRKAWLALLAFALISFAGCTREEPSKAPVPAAPETTPAAEKAVAADFTVRTFSGGEFTLSAHRGGPVVINFWASWCGPCRFEAPSLQKAFDDYGPRGVTFIGVAVQDTDEQAKGFVEKFGLTFPNGRDSTGEIMNTYDIYAIPQTFIIGRDGRISYVHTGPVPADVLASEIEKAL